MQDQKINISKEPIMFSIGRASEHLGVSIDTLRRWEKKGRIKARRSPGGHRYFIKEELNELFNKKYTRDRPTKKRKSEPKFELNRDTEIKKAKINTISDFSESVFIQEKILDRPIREFSIPEQKPIMIRAVLESQNTIASFSQEIPNSHSLTDFHKQEILAPEIPHPQAATHYPVQHTPTPQIDTQASKNNDQLNFTKKETIIIISTLIVITICFAILFFFSPQKEIISPIPN